MMHNIVFELTLDEQDLTADAEVILVYLLEHLKYYGIEQVVGSYHYEKVPEDTHVDQTP